MLVWTPLWTNIYFYIVLLHKFQTCLHQVPMERWSEVYIQSVSWTAESTSCCELFSIPLRVNNTSSDVYIQMSFRESLTAGICWLHSGWYLTTSPQFGVLARTWPWMFFMAGRSVVRALVLWVRAQVVSSSVKQLPNLLWVNSLW